MQAPTEGVFVCVCVPCVRLFERVYVCVFLFRVCTVLCTLLFGGGVFCVCVCVCVCVYVCAHVHVHTLASLVEVEYNGL